MNRNPHPARAAKTSRQATDKLHDFLVTVRTLSSRKSAYYSVLAAFGMRQPDYCKFYLHYRKPRLSPRKTKPNANKRKKK